MAYLPLDLLKLKAKVADTNQEAGQQSDSEPEPEEVRETGKVTSMVGRYAGSRICFCDPDSEGNPTAPYNITCQAMVNRGIMSETDKNDVCECKEEYVIISESEKERLETVWKKNNRKFEWVFNEKDGFYYDKIID